MKLYVASSWRNAIQPDVVKALRAAGHDVYDFRNPPHGRGGFAWSDIDPAWESWTPEEYRTALESPIAQAGFNSDYEGMVWAESGVLVMPCGRSAHLEAGYFNGAGKPLFILTSDAEPELMYSMATGIMLDVPELLEAIACLPPPIPNVTPGEVASGARSHLRGHPIRWDGARWRYVDTGEPTASARRHCGRCGLQDSPEGHDACLATLPGVLNACCGHGDPAQAYIQFETGMIVRGFTIDEREQS